MPASKTDQSFTFTRRGSGLLLHPTSLPSPYGWGDVGPESYRFVDFLSSARQRWWQMLPVSPPGQGNSPYSSYSAFAGSPWLVNLELLARDGLLKRGEVVAKGLPRRATFEAMCRFRAQRLRTAFDRFRREPNRFGSMRKELAAFSQRNAAWLNDYTLFAAIKESLPAQSWSSWPRDLKFRKPAALEKARQRLADQVEFHAFTQLLFERQWQALKSYANERGVGLIGDIPIFLAYDSADVWANPHLFLLDASLKPTVVSGCPPDAFACEGQLWGHPHYDWRAQARDDFAWWVGRFRSMMSRFDGVRIDHFLGFHQFWAVPARAKTAVGGRYMPGPRDKFFDALRRQLGDVPIIAEDLGAVTPEALALRDRFRLPGMRVLQFGFGEGGDYHLPHRYPRCSVAYIGTHDNETAAGWFGELRKRKDAGGQSEKRKVNEYVHNNGEPIEWALTRLLMRSVADTVIFQVQDVLGLGKDARMNVPGTAEGNWMWRMRPGSLTPALASRLRQMAEVYDRV